jgi:hypothetical protein
LKVNQVPPPGQSDDEIQDLAMLVAENLNNGESPDVIVEQLVGNGWEEDDAIGFVASIQHRINPPAEYAGKPEGEGMGWLLWIGGVLLINFLSYVFGWGFYIY